ncbi:hypothetical protein [Magnetospirillum aberrantis]|uniref:DUF1795 domain-containing protein n=1 Tax=Magnetospirillum aberrantis SpK TaxID=908842 RepID=A0A7C9UWB1_9PROT|nr:hypothetical protein [Magnetospirillum aberrantis]NFV80589.1 hypothetical protein [Magnetospirillum aberrantis SpK]
MMKRLFVLGLLLTVAACSQYQLVPAGNVKFVDDGATTSTPVAWNGHNTESLYTWTQDGPLLENMLFHINVKDGKTLTKGLDVERTFDPLAVLFGTVPDEVSYRFNKAMTEPEIMDLFTASYARIFGSPVTATNLRPATLGGEPGFRFEYAFTGKDEVRRIGIAVGAVVDSKLTLVHYYGTEMYHFQKHRDDAEQVIAAFRFDKKS